MILLLAKVIPKKLHIQGVGYSMEVGNLSKLDRLSSNMVYVEQIYMS